MLIDLSHTIEHGMITYQGLPEPVISDFLTREKSRERYSEGTEFQIGRIDMVANTGTYIDAPAHRFADGADVAAINLEHLTNPDSLPNEREIRLFAVPPKVRGLGSFPVRAFAMV